VARYGVGDFSSFVSCKKGIACLTLSEKRAGEAAWVVAFFNSCGFLAGGIIPLHQYNYTSIKLAISLTTSV